MRFGVGPRRWLRPWLSATWQPAAVRTRVRKRRRAVSDHLRLRTQLLSPVIAHLERIVAEAESGAAPWGWPGSPRRIRLLRAGVQRLKVRRQALSALAAQVELSARAVADDAVAPPLHEAASRTRQSSAADYDE
jgi:hypothetical protein